MRILSHLFLLPISSAFVGSSRRQFLCSSATAATTTRLFATEARSDCWRPTVSDVERISFGKPAKKKGTGSRGVPHRLNADERQSFDRARTRGYLEVTGSGWRSQRREAPLLNTYRSICDARSQVCIVLHKQNTGMDDLVVDFSPLRLPETFSTVAQQCLEQSSIGGGSIISQPQESKSETEESAGETEIHASTAAPDDDPWETRPIYHLPPFCVAWERLSRSDAKALGKQLAQHFGTAEGKRAASKKPVGVKHGKSRRHGGYGIG